MPGAGPTITSVLSPPILAGLAVPTGLAVADPWRRATEIPSLVVGAVVLVSGLAMLVRAGKDRIEAGEELPTNGLFAHCRNPLYLAVLAILAGLSMASRSPILGVYLLSAAIGLHLWVVRVVEPRAERAFGDRWHRYRHRVPRWFPRLSRSLPVAGRRG